MTDIAPEFFEVYESLRKGFQREIYMQFVKYGQMTRHELEISFSAGKNRARLRDNLEILVLKGVLEEVPNHGVILYQICVTSTLQSVTSTLPNVTSTLPNVTSTLPNVTSTLPNVTSDSPTCTCIQSSQSIIQKEFSEGFESQALVVSEPVSTPEPAGPAVVSPSPSAAPVPPDRPKASKRDFHYGVIFDDPSDVTKSLYKMLERMHGKMTVDPDSTLSTPIPEIPMMESFVKCVQKGYFYALSMPGRPIIRDYVLHRMAFFLVYSEDFILGDEHSVEQFIESACLENKLAPWNPLLDSLASKFIRREWGWDGRLLSNEDTQDAERFYAEKHGLSKEDKELRKQMFPSYWSRSSFVKKKVKKLSQSGGEHPRADPSHSELTGRDPGRHPILVAIADRLRGSRLIRWDEQTTFSDDGGTPVFTMPNEFSMALLRQNGREEIATTLKALRYLPGLQFGINGQSQAVSGFL